MNKQALEINLTGRVQGVGFRPRIWHLAREHQLSGEVTNTPQGVRIRVCGERVEAFVTALRERAPSQARILEFTSRPIAPFAAREFSIAPSAALGADNNPGGAIAPDLATCPACLAEIRGDGRRRGYAFTNCADCGPRFSIVTDNPYDRVNTSMANFAMCEDCAREYADPVDRRFHAQPIACPVCGPQLNHSFADIADALLTGKLVALKGLGCFHLLCDATNQQAITELRNRKHRPAKPLALLARDLTMLCDYAEVNQDEATLLASSAAPIVLLAKAGQPLPNAIAPGLDRCGWMLPATPLHHMLAARVNRPLVMTSANLSGEPPATNNTGKLTELAELVVDHNRVIARRLDDSVAQFIGGDARLVRRARGYAPEPIFLPPAFADLPQALALGAQLKATFCYLHRGRALLSQEFGDLDNPNLVDAFTEALEDYRTLFGFSPTLLACDLHPDYATTRLAERMTHNEELPLMRIGHHHAHLAAVMGENACQPDERLVGIVLDGLGIGSDSFDSPEGRGRLCGGEILFGGYAEVSTITSLKPVPLPGGDAAQREPWRNLLAQLDAAQLHLQADILIPGKPLQSLRRAMEVGINSPLSSSAGRLFDALACALGCAPEVQSYEAEAAMRLETLASRAVERSGGYPLHLNEWIDPAPMWRELLRDLAAGAAPAEIAWRAHAGIAQAICTAAKRAADAHGVRAIALSGGCMHNALFFELCQKELVGYRLLAHTVLPPGDGCIAFGQALAAVCKNALVPCA